MEPEGKTRVLIAGGGVAALEAALALRALASDEVSVELLAPETHFWYRPLAVVAPFHPNEPPRFALDDLTRAIGASLTPGALVAVDVWGHVAHTSQGAEIEYDTLLIACGAVPTPAIAGALTFRGPADTEKIEHLLAEIETRAVRSVTFAIPWGAVWSLPAYELALLTATYLEERSVDGVKLSVVTPEQEPLQVFGPPASAALQHLLDGRGIELRAGVYAREFKDAALQLIPDGRIEAERVVALPRLQGEPIDGLPQTVGGFIPVDAHCRVQGVEDVFAAGDITNFAVKQGGIATQQADCAAEAIAASAGAGLTPSRFRPVLRGMLLTGREPRYLRRELTATPEQEPVFELEPLWWPAVKIVGRHLAPFLASLVEIESPPETSQLPPEALQVEVELDPETIEELSSSSLRVERSEPEDRDAVEAFMSRELVLAEPEDTLGEVAEKLEAANASAAVVCDFGRLIGILTTSDLLHATAAKVHASDARARQWMTAEPVTASRSTPIAAAAAMMDAYGIHHLVILDDGQPVGMLNLEDAERNAPTALELG